MVVGTRCTMILLHRLWEHMGVGLTRRPIRASSISIWYLAASEAGTEGGVRRMMFLLLVMEEDKNTNWWWETAALIARRILSVVMVTGRRNSSSIMSSRFTLV